MQHGNLPQAEKTARTARKLLDDFAGFKPAQFATVEANLLDTLTHILVGLGMQAEAAQIAGRAVALYRNQVARPEADPSNQEELMFGLMTRAKIEMLLQRPQEAKPCFVEALGILMRLQHTPGRARLVEGRILLDCLAGQFKESTAELPDGLLESAMSKLKDWEQASTAS